MRSKSSSKVMLPVDQPFGNSGTGSTTLDSDCYFVEAATKICVAPSGSTKVGTVVPFFQFILWHLEIVFTLRLPGMARIFESQGSGKHAPMVNSLEQKFAI